ncbi:MAG: hypothetical protein QME35_05095 [Thermoanaerobacteraceae bacterium]|nr:hypothetical protein [Thermoanaerobacteraceae bacterium]
MANFLEKSINFGFGLYSLSKEKIENMVDELVKKGEVAREDAQGVVKDLVKKGEEQKDEIKKIFKDALKETFDYMNIAKKEDLITKEEIRKLIHEELKNILDEEKSQGRQM